MVGGEVILKKYKKRPTIREQCAREMGILPYFSVPNSRYVVIYRGIPVGCDFQHEVIQILERVRKRGEK